MTRPLAPWRQLHVRAALVAIPLLVLLGATMFAMLRHYSAQTGLESTQRMNLGLAGYVVEHQEPGLISATGEPDRARMKALALHVMMINPAVEVYLLGADGRVLAHALEGLQGTDPVGRWVDLAPVQSLLGTPPEALRLPVFGTDPRHGGTMNVVSVAPLSTPAGMAGYLYIVLNGQTLQSVNASLANSGALRAVALGLVLATLLAGVVLLLALRKLTRPLRDLTTVAGISWRD